MSQLYCIICREYKDASMFRKNDSVRGREDACLRCQRDKAKATEQADMQDAFPVNPWNEKRRIDFIAAKETHRSSMGKEGKRAREKVRQALSLGKLKRVPCQASLPNGKRCGSIIGLEFHHYSYDRGRELDGIFVCKIHHDQISAEARKKKHSI